MLSNKKSTEKKKLRLIIMKIAHAIHIYTIRVDKKHLFSLNSDKKNCCNQEVD